MDEPEIACVHEESRTLADDEDGIPPVDRVGEQREAAARGEIPERAGHDTALSPLGGDPLHDEASREEGLAQQTDEEPGVLARHLYRRLVVRTEPRVA